MRSKTRQQTFSQAIRGMLKQGQLSADENGNCRYRAGSLRCVAGQLIPDCEYRPSMEGTGASGGSVARALRDHGHDPAFVRDLQYIHDSAVSFRDFVRESRSFARDCDLKMPKVRK